MVNLSALLGGWTERLVREGLIQSFWFRRAPGDHSTLLDVRFHDHCGATYRLTDEEVANGGLEGAEHWLRVIEEDIRARRGSGIVVPLVFSVANDHWRLDELAVTGLNPIGWGDAAETRARNLFLAVAGVAAVETMEAGKPLRIKGSEGTRYLLFKRAAYCVERESDGTRLCAVVPGVPLWDHLLGVKLMVEGDEPAFLAAANVAMPFRTAEHMNSRIDAMIRERVAAGRTTLG